MQSTSRSSSPSRSRVKRPTNDAQEPCLFRNKLHQRSKLAECHALDRAASFANEGDVEVGGQVQHRPGNQQTLGHNHQPTSLHRRVPLQNLASSTALPTARCGTCIFHVDTTTQDRTQPHRRILGPGVLECECQPSVIGAALAKDREANRGGRAVAAARFGDLGPLDSPQPRGPSRARRRRCMSSYLQLEIRFEQMAATSH